jgi:hypothetical protein
MVESKKNTNRHWSCRRQTSSNSKEGGRIKEGRIRREEIMGQY